MRRARLPLGLLLLGLPGTAGATTTAPLTLAQQAQKAEVIVRATVGTPTTSKEGDVTYTVYPLTVSETVAGDAASLPQYEGRPALFFLQGLQDVPSLGSGQELFALLYARKADSPLVGFNQGLYPVTNGAVAVLPGGNAAAPTGSAPPTPPAAITDPNALRDAIRAARENR